jgi:hypothetical protein
MSASPSPGLLRDVRSAAPLIFIISLSGPQFKRCKTCRIAKPRTDFPAHRRARDGRRLHCRECLLSGRYRPQPETAAQREQRRVRQSRPERVASHNEAIKRYRRRFPSAVAAASAINVAVRTGRERKADSCQVAGCNSREHLEAHHWSYEREHWLDVLWCCAAHHRQGHAQGFIIPAEGIAAHYGTIPELAAEATEAAS